MAYQYQGYGNQPHYGEDPRMMQGQPHVQPGMQQQQQHHQQGSGLLEQIAGNPMFVNTATHMLQQTTSAYMPGISGFWASLKAYFMVNNRYVLQKLQTLFVPFMKTNWNRILMEEVDQSMPVDTHKFALPLVDVNAPDLYIPLMGYMTFVILNGFARGAANSFTPQSLVQTTSSCLVMEIIQVLATRVALQLMQATIPWIDLFAYSGYKYVMLCTTTASWLLFGDAVYLLVFFYMGAALVFFSLKTLSAAVPAGNTQGPPRHVVIGAVSVAQLLIVWWLGRQ